jgi:hypothetical protein
MYLVASNTGSTPAKSFAGLPSPKAAHLHGDGVSIFSLIFSLPFGFSGLYLLLKQGKKSPWSNYTSGKCLQGGVWCHFTSGKRLQGGVWRHSTSGKCLQGGVWCHSTSGKHLQGGVWCHSTSGKCLRKGLGRVFFCFQYLPDVTQCCFATHKPRTPPVAPLF